MVKHVFIVLALAGSYISAAAQTAPLRFVTIVGNGQSTNSCSLVKRDVDLEARLKELGWITHGANYPQIGWKSGKIAAVITTSDQYAHFRKNGAVSLKNHKVKIHMDADDHNSIHAQIFVLELDSKYTGASSCVVDYEDLISTLVRKASTTTGASVISTASPAAAKTMAK
jgi:hypothetical protein